MLGLEIFRFWANPVKMKILVENMNFRLKYISNKIKIYWRLFFQKMPLLRNATLVAIFCFWNFAYISLRRTLEFSIL